MGTSTRHSVHMEVRGQLCAVSFLPPHLLGFWGSNSGLKLEPSAPLPSVPYCWRPCCGWSWGALQPGGGEAQTEVKAHPNPPNLILRPEGIGLFPPCPGPAWPGARSLTPPTLAWQPGYYRFNFLSPYKDMPSMHLEFLHIQMKHSSTSAQAIDIHTSREPLPNPQGLYRLCPLSHNKESCFTENHLSLTLTPTKILPNLPALAELQSLQSSTVCNGAYVPQGEKHIRSSSLQGLELKRSLT